MSRISQRTWPGGIAAAVAALALTVAVVPSPVHAAPLEPVYVDGMNLDSGGTAVINDLQRTDVAPGLVHVAYERLDATGWQQVDILRAELSEDTVRVGYLTPETVSGPGATVTELVDGSGAIAGVNLDRFDINNSNAAAGWGVSGGELIKSGNPDASASIVIDENGLGSLANLLLVGAAGFGEQSVAIRGINTFALDGGVGLYTSQWGAFSRARALNGAAGVEVLIGADDTVLSVSEAPGAGTLEPGVRALVTKADGPEAAVLRSLEPGDAADIAYSIDAGALDVREAGGAWHRILRDGVVVDAGNPDLHPRTMVGFSQDGATAYFVQLDGRSAIARGMTLTEQGRFMKDLGAHDATNADGGGSSQMNVRDSGQRTSRIVNTPSDGFERHDGDGLGFFLAQPSSGVLAGYRLEPALAGVGGLRVFPGLSRTLSAHGHDEAGTAVAASVGEWASADSAIATVADGVVHGVSPGETTVTARTGAADGSAEAQVLGDLDRITTDLTTINLEAKDATAVVTLTGHDPQGFAAPIEARDVTVVNPAPETFSVEPTADGRFQVTAIGDVGTTTLAFEVAGERTEVAVAVPLEVRLIDDFSTIEGWTTAHDRAPTGGIAPGEGHDGDPSIRIDYDFTESTGTRGRYAVAPGAVTGGSGGIDIPGIPQKLSVWIKGDGNGSLLRLQVMQANGVRNWIDGPGGSQSLHATWTGWERVDFLVPETFAFPLKLERIRVLETVAAKQYTGSLEFSKIYAYLPPEGTQSPALGRAEDPIVVDAGETDDDALRVAVVSDAQFVARDPDSGAVQGARDALREIVAAEPDVMLLNGDFVDEASAADFELAKRILDEELADVDFPWFYLPGNHEIMGASIDNFRAAFGETNRTVDIDGTRLIMLNSASGKLATEFAQVQMLRQQLDAAASDSAVTGVLVVSHMPTNDPLPTKGSQLSDRNEAALVDDWIQQFRAESGKSAAYIAGHVGAFHASSVDGVPYVVNGNSGKSPASTPADGGFTGWTMLGIDPDQGTWRDATDAWLEVETKPRVDEGGLTVDAPGTLGLGGAAEISAEFAQDEGARTVPVAWPVSSRWGGEGVHIGAAEDAPAGTIVAVDPRDGTVSALAVGDAQIAVTVNGETATAQIEVVADLDVSVSAVTRTLGGRQYVSVSVTNDEAAPLDVTVGSAFGGKTFSNVAPGKTVSVSLNSRSAFVAAGEVEVTVTGEVDGAPVTVTKTAAYPAAPTE
ncbi:phosphodiester glycosidase family protein [Microbacterium sp. NPDC055910]|uniref:phosphodiester glycosidase family protein n=1 Tax=Microbacterium sp. NPDC055910 TaxID=3345659 RepID=UPI0035DA418D